MHGQERWRQGGVAPSNPSARLRAARSMPHWVQQQRGGLPAPPPPPPEADTPPEPDYEVIDFPNQQYSNTNITGSVRARRCDLCGTGGPSVHCSQCPQQNFCASCDEMYHRHPKRQAHVRKALDVCGRRQDVRPPLPPKGELLAVPVPPPRRHKRNPTPSSSPRLQRSPDLRQIGMQQRYPPPPAAKDSGLVNSLRKMVSGRNNHFASPPLSRERSSSVQVPPQQSWQGLVNPADQMLDQDMGMTEWDMANHGRLQRVGSMAALAPGPGMPPHHGHFAPMMHAQSMAQLNCPNCWGHMPPQAWGSQAGLHMHGPPPGWYPGWENTTTTRRRRPRHRMGSSSEEESSPSMSRRSSRSRPLQSDSEEERSPRRSRPHSRRDSYTEHGRRHDSDTLSMRGGRSDLDETQSLRGYRQRDSDMIRNRKEDTMSERGGRKQKYNDEFTNDRNARSKSNARQEIERSDRRRDEDFGRRRRRGDEDTMSERGGRRSREDDVMSEKGSRSSKNDEISSERVDRRREIDATLERHRRRRESEKSLDRSSKKDETQTISTRSSKRRDSSTQIEEHRNDRRRNENSSPIQQNDENDTMYEKDLNHLKVENDDYRGSYDETQNMTNEIDEKSIRKSKRHERFSDTGQRRRSTLEPRKDFMDGSERSDSMSVKSSSASTSNEISNNVGKEADDEERENSLGPIPTTKWECDHCTYVNDPGTRVCDVCCKTTTHPRLIISKSKTESANKTPSLSDRFQQLDISAESHKPKKKESLRELQNENTVQKSRGQISTGTSPPPQSISTQTYEVAGYKVKRASSFAEGDWVSGQRTFSRQSIDSHVSATSPMRSRSPDVDNAVQTDSLIQSTKSTDPTPISTLRKANRAGSQPPDYMSSLVQKQVKQGLEMVKLLREAEAHQFGAEEVAVALEHCGDSDPVDWLVQNWRNMVDTVVTLGTNYGHERKENTIGTISVREARDSLKTHSGNVWAAVTDVVHQRQKKYAELMSRGNFTREDIVTVLTAHHGDLEAAYNELNKGQLKPFLMRIWGPPTEEPSVDHVKS